MGNSHRWVPVTDDSKKDKAVCPKCHHLGFNEEWQPKGFYHCRKCGEFFKVKRKGKDND